MIPKPFLIKLKEKTKDREAGTLYAVVATGIDAESHDFFLIVDSDGGMNWVDENTIREDYLFAGFLDTTAGGPETWRLDGS